MQTYRTCIEVRTRAGTGAGTVAASRYGSDTINLMKFLAALVLQNWVFVTQYSFYFQLNFFPKKMQNVTLSCPLRPKCIHQTCILHTHPLRNFPNLQCTYTVCVKQSNVTVTQDNQCLKYVCPTTPSVQFSFPPSQANTSLCALMLSRSITLRVVSLKHFCFLHLSSTHSKPKLNALTTLGLNTILNRCPSHIRNIYLLIFTIVKPSLYFMTVNLLLECTILCATELNLTFAIAPYNRETITLYE
jgi:hypothetical protein